MTPAYVLLTILSLPAVVCRTGAATSVPLAPVASSLPLESVLCSLLGRVLEVLCPDTKPIAAALIQQVSINTAYFVLTPLLQRMSTWAR